MVNHLVTLREVESVLRGFAKYKSHGMDGWLVELFLEFFDTMGIDILHVVEESRTIGKVYNGLNSTYIALIPKFPKLDTFSDFRPIYLCNMIYTVISKIIVRRVKSVLSRCISRE